MLENPLFDKERFGEVFDEEDRLLIDAALRLVQRQSPIEDVSPDLYAGLLLVAKALRHNHAAIDLGPEEFGSLFRELWTTRISGEDRFRGEKENPDRLRQSLLEADERLVGRSAMESASVSTGGSPFVVSTSADEARYISSRRLLHAESRIAEAVLQSSVQLDLNPALPTLEELVSIEPLEFLEPIHLAFFERALNRRISILTGGPGSGKTTSIASLLRRVGLIAKARGDAASRRVRVALCAPTAKAAVRMSESIDERLGGAGLADFIDVLEIDRRSGSVHRLLGVRPDATKSDQTIDADLVIVDEVSMLELPLFDSLLLAARHAHVILVGDPEQLRSVEVGAVLNDLVEAGRGPDGALSEILTELPGSHRFNEELAGLARAINVGDAKGALDVIVRSSGPIRMVDKPQDVLDEVLQRARRLRHSAENGDVEESLGALRQLVVLGANREGDQSVGWWQRTIQAALESEQPWPDPQERFSVGMSLMITKNERSLARRQTDLLANGDVGVVIRTPDGPRAFFLPLEAGRSRSLAELDQAEPAWAFTIHKSQGSEYGEVVVSLPSDVTNRILSRELLYTAVTRAKSEVVIVGSENVLAAAIRRSVDRVSGLSERVSVRRGTLLAV